MFSVIDRYILRSLLLNYLIALGVMMSLYVVLDLFVNMDEFTEHGYPFWTVLGNIIDYYGPNLLLYFAQLSGVITLFACLAVLARMRRFNELTAVLASGVSLHRVAAPIIAFGLLSTGLLVLDTEWWIPSVAYKLARDRDDIDGQRAYEILFMLDRDNRLLSAMQFHPTTRDMRQMLVLARNDDGTVAETWEADRAVWEPAPPPAPGRWRLERGKRVRRITSGENSRLDTRERKEITYPRYYDSLLSPESIELRQAEGWIRFLSLSQLRELQERGKADLKTILKIRHARIVAPIVCVVLLLLGLPFFLDRSPANVVRDAGKCLVVCGLCYVASFVAQSIRPETQSALPAWIPIFVFGTLAVVLIDRVRT